MIQKLNAEGRLEKKEAKKGGSYIDKVRHCVNCLCIGVLSSSYIESLYIIKKSITIEMILFSIYIYCGLH